jgi:hypothetical protein
MTPQHFSISLVVTSIARPNAVLRSLAEGSERSGIRFLVIGDSKSPADFQLNGCEFHSLESQRRSGFRVARLCPERSYARKNIGYLMAIRDGSEVVIETDDDNFPREGFWGPRRRTIQAKRVECRGWLNAYRYFSDGNIWPRGLPLTEMQNAVPRFEDLPVREADCPIQQGLADQNPDVDAVYRLLLPLPQSFRADRRLALGSGAWCPFNSQNTTWWADAFPLMYLPAHCSFRMTDIWRSFVAQRIAWVNSWSVLFHEPTVWQERNEHNLMRDFQDEIPGYLLNAKIGQILDALDLRRGKEHIPDNLLTCYRALIELGAVAAAELPLLDAWLQDVLEYSEVSTPVAV